MIKILIVDDEVQLQEIYAAFLKGHGYTDIHFASDGLEAFQKCFEHKFDLITLDHQMPYLTGAEFLKALRLKPNQNEKSPVIMISGYIPDIDHACKSFDNTFFFDKPVDFEKLLKYVKMITGKKEISAAS